MTAKTRNISFCILAGTRVSLFNRINSQTVRTKYMTIDHAQLCASSLEWSDFSLVSRASDPPSIGAVVGISFQSSYLTFVPGGPQLMGYGCSIILSDAHSGISTPPLIIRKVVKGGVFPDEGGLSPRIRGEVKDGVHVVTDDVDDYLCWTIVGISKFQYTFFDAFRQINTIPDMPITPFPTLFTAPVYRQTNNTLELVIANFCYTDPTTAAHTPLDVYLGNLGPLRHRVYQVTQPGPSTNIAPFVNGTGGSVVVDTPDLTATFP
ncbi:beta-trefoil DNA-binding domain-containing protein [Favolaschia claudopus]|uniref:Beta-trefoil DNA-binding domain-containing protein n=1 Tax=Favolaschia claudopus TaxID=2862362 RepID=A0AAV9ZJ50_9AGAR